jgi:hypothetical protein
MLFLSLSRGKVVHLHKARNTYLEVRTEDVEGFIETVEDCLVMHFFKFEVSFLGTRELFSSHIVDFFIELVEDVFGYDGFEAVHDSILVFLRTLLVNVSLQERDSFVDIVTVWHVNEPQKIVFVVD